MDKESKVPTYLRQIWKKKFSLAHKLTYSKNKTLVHK